jgi:hypothetical protein
MTEADEARIAEAIRNLIRAQKASCPLHAARAEAIALVMKQLLGQEVEI